ncbi:NlpC/P60 family protein [Cryobacterium sp. TmT2-59]|uniref:NlpC/P60 family protein n=1 Tax=Cryobacterium shii TaxID=1259235 RepID=A0AAQ2C8G0_9MICO|nr:MULTISPECIES: C40 family peptidase [Cryobacterium]TFC52102.1 NlpC/P60 family protein [Cryobacterium shii]TFC84655.1 NlpC/P60 family protein [Cryobacterium sp. TmT2-59]TFD16248.1 NlpC/P60 family protein [Cryobacterium sp. TMT2-23]TFD19052.1 NlpC/P60 family protein [Cryobacterium sp. TMT4-10]
MSMVDALSRIGQIQAALEQFNTVQGTKAAAATAASAGASTFASALASATGTSATGSARATPATGSATGTDIVAAAEKYLGVPYVFGGEDGSGMDCSGLVQTVYADMGITVPRLVSGQMKIGTEVGSLAQAKPGDLIVTGGGEHILIYAGNHKVIHAPYEGRTVCLVEAYMDDSDIDTIRRVIPDAPAAPASAAGTTDLVGAALASLMNGRS